MTTCDASKTTGQICRTCGILNVPWLICVPYGFHQWLLLWL